MIEAEGLEIPDPKVTNPELFYLANRHAPIFEFVQAMNKAGIKVTGQQILNAINNPDNFQLRTDIHGNRYFQFTYTITQDALSYSTGFIYDEENGWKELSLRLLGEKKGLKFGTEGRTESVAVELAKEQVNTVALGGSWKNIELKRGKYDFNNYIGPEIDLWQSLGKEVNNFGIIFPTSGNDIGDTLPDWLVEEWNRGYLSKEDLELIIRDYVSTLVNYGKEKGINQWVVTNEPYFPQYRINDIFYRAFGNYEYIDVAFETAREANPDAILIYADGDNHSSNGLTTKLTLENVNRLKSKSVNGKPLIDAVGVQGHYGPWGSPPTSEEDIINTLSNYGLPIVVLEFDYNISEVKGTDPERQLEKARVYQMFLSAALKAGVKEITFWGLDPNNYWLQDDPDADALLFREGQDGQPEKTLAYYVVMNLLSEYIPEYK
jgi:hypothetical protein